MYFRIEKLLFEVRADNVLFEPLRRVVFSSFVRDRAFAQAPDALEVFPRQECERDVCANDHQRNDTVLLQTV